MLGASAYFAYKIYEHIQTLEDSNQNSNNNYNSEPTQSDNRSMQAFSTVSSEELLEKADTAFEDGDSEKALAYLLESDAKSPNNSEVLFKIGYILQSKDDLDAALDYYKRSLEIDRDDEFVHNSVASIYRANKEYSSARMHLNESLSINDQNPLTYYNYGNLLVDMGHDEEAISMYEKALEIDSEFTQAKEELEKLK
jgi:tetratricopeptide (TPR) repeat protein